MKKKVIAIMVVMGVLLAMVAAFFAKQQYDKKVEADKIKQMQLDRTVFLTNECVELQALGGDGEGWINIEINKSELENLFKEKINPKYEFGMEWLETAKKISDETTLTISKDKNLSNGDVITVEINVPEEILNKYNLIVSDNIIEFEISDLPDSCDYEPFDGIYFDVEKDENGQDIINLLYNNDFIKGYSADTVFDFYTTDDKPISSEEFEVGMEIKFCLDEEFVELYKSVGYFPKTTEKTFVIEGNEKVKGVSDVNELSEEFITELKAEASTKIIQLYKTYDIITVNNLELMGMYFSVKDNYHKNELVMVYKVNIIYDNGNKTGSTYITATTSMILINENGKNIAFGKKSELAASSSLIDPNTMLQIRGESLELIMTRVKDYTVIN